MSTSFSVRVLGSVFAVEVDASVPAEVQSAIPAQWAGLVTVDAPDEATRYRLTLDAASEAEPGAQTILASSADEAPDRLAGALTVAGLHRLAGEALMFHAAGLAYDDGGVIALVGPSGRGKTTACQRLGHVLGYVTDETVAVRPDLSVIPYPKPLSVGSRPGTKELHAPADIGMRPAPENLRLAAIVLLDRDQAVISPGIEPVSAIDAIGDLVAQTSSLSRLPRPLQTLLEIIDVTGGVRRMRYADGHELETLVGRVLHVRGEVAQWSAVDVERPQGELTAGFVARTEFDDAVFLDGRLVVLAGRRLHVLDGIGPEVWLGADGVESGALRERVIAVHGDAPSDVDIDQFLAQTLDQLIDVGLLRRG
ncbi:hypothetical protein [Microbacterium sp.]|uniref:hypothetical protein n=1 Tax=Microbacterium sp. TaxID=51671 RepID=UPI0037C9C498